MASLEEISGKLDALTLKVDALVQEPKDFIFDVAPVELFNDN